MQINISSYAESLIIFFDKWYAAIGILTIRNIASSLSGNARLNVIFSHNLESELEKETNNQIKDLRLIAYTFVFTILMLILFFETTTEITIFSLVSFLIIMAVSQIGFAWINNNLVTRRGMDNFSKARLRIRKVLCLIDPSIIGATPPGRFGISLMINFSLLLLVLLKLISIVTIIIFKFDIYGAFLVFFQNKWEIFIEWYKTYAG